ncbi:MAG: AAA family ATPase [Candidatus Schekmanbacteria bacterium]|nr:AAA family ATPase [Candidatus Schekmanbacteria bacterium]
MNPFVPQLIAELDAAGVRSGGFRAASLFVDITGFTALTELHQAGGKAGAEALAEALRFYFDPLVDAVHGAGGFVAGFAGDAFTAVFPESSSSAEIDSVMHVAAQCRELFRCHPSYENLLGQFAFSARIGVAFGDVAWDIVEIGDGRATYLVQGECIDACASAEQRAAPGEVVFHASLAARCPRLAERWQQAIAAAQHARSGPPTFRAPDGRAATPLAVPANCRFVPLGAEEVPQGGEFRMVTTAFVGFRNAPDLPELTRWLAAKCAAYGGTFVRIDFGDKGGNCLVPFGAPRSWENDRERAVDFAIDIRDTAPAPLEVRAGISRGVRYVGFNGGTNRLELACLGKATNLAARLLSTAPWGAVWCDRELFGDDAHGYFLSRVGRFAFKGFEESVPVFAVRRKRLRLRSPRRPALEPPLCDRDRELAALLSELSSADAQRHLRVLHVTGDLGIGKSYLVAATRRALASRLGPAGFLWFAAPCDGTFRHPFNPFEHAIRIHFRQSPRKDEAANALSFRLSLDALAGKLALADAALRAELRRAAPYLATLAGLQPPGVREVAEMAQRRSHESTLLAITTWIRAEATVHPLVVIELENAHWLDGDSLAAARELCRTGADLPIALVLIARNADDGSAQTAAVGADLPGLRLNLTPLSREGLRRMAAAAIGSAVPETLVDDLQHRSGGNPLFAEEILALVRQSGELGARAPEQLPDVAHGMLPERAAGLLVARLDRLPKPVRRVTQAAAILGPRFTSDVLQRMLWPLSENLAECLEMAERERIVVPSGEAAWSFRNGMLREAALGLLSPSEARRLHTLAALALEQLDRTSSVAEKAGLADHWRHAGDPSRAASCYCSAALQAAAAYAPVQAERLYRDALSLLVPATEAAIRVRLALARDVLAACGDAAGALAEAREACAQAERISNPTLAAACRAEIAHAQSLA